MTTACDAIGQLEVTWDSSEPSKSVHYVDDTSIGSRRKHVLIAKRNLNLKTAFQTKISILD